VRLARGERRVDLDCVWPKRMGIVQEVRTAVGNEQTVVDCAGLSGKERVDRFVAEAFGEALGASSAGCQVTLTIGGGKATRGK